MNATHVLIALATLVAACGPAGSDTPTDDLNNLHPNSQDGETASVVELLPEGFERVAAGRFSPDGSRLAMIAMPPGDDATEQLITTDLDGGNVEVLVTDGLSYLSTIAWMPDGRSLLYGGGGGIMEVRFDGSEPTLVVDSFAVESVDVSHDGGLVSWSVNGGTTVTTAPLSADPAPRDTHVDGPTGDMPRFGPDGQIAFVTSEGVVLSQPNGDNLQTFDASTNFFSNLAWRSDDELVVITNHGLTAVDLTSGETTDLHEQHAALAVDVSPDGAMFVLGVNGQTALRLGSF